MFHNYTACRIIIRVNKPEILIDLLHGIKLYL